MLKAVIFDMDGVIVDTEPIYGRVEKEMFSDLGLDIPDDEYSTFVGTSSRDTWNLLREKYKISLSVDELCKIEADNYVDALKTCGEAILVPGVKELIQELYNNGVKIALATSSVRNIADIVLKTFRLEGYFQAVVGGDEVERSKPSPDLYMTAVRRLSIEPEHCIAIEDSKNGVRAAKAAGLKCVAFRNPNSGSQDISCADAIVDGIKELNYIELKRILKC